MIIGHENKVIFFEKALENKALSHAYCFVGPESVGKRVVVCDLAAKILKTDVEKLLTHPDFFCLTREIDDKKGRLKKDLSVLQAKQVRKFLQNRSWFEKGTRITMIEEAELLNEEAANALLKTIEETGENSLMFLLTVNDMALPATVRSRCQIINFDLVSDEEILSGLKKMGFDAEAAEEAVLLSWGRPGRALRLLAEPDLLADYHKEFKRWTNFLKQPFYEKLKSVEDLFADKDSVRNGDKIKKVLDIWIMLWREFLLRQMSHGEKGRGRRMLPFERPIEMPAEKILEIIDDLRAIQNFLNRNINPRLMLEHFFLKS